MRELTLFLLALLVFNALGCTRTDDPALAPVIVVMCLDVDPAEDPHPCCLGFALSSQVVTASHCVPGDTALIVTRKQWQETASASEIGRVVQRDADADIVWLDAPLDGPGLAQGPPVQRGDPVSVLTDRGVLPGVTTYPAGSFWLTDVNSRLGDSGAAVVDASGRAVGVLSRCLTKDFKECDPNSGIFASLP